jgi:cyclophilin family peptidyl-prolyl cis-trans isomerase
MRLALLAALLLAIPAARAQAPADSLPATNVYEIETPKGRIVVRLFDETPLHRDNFKRRAAAGLYDSTLFHRVIAGFMAQGGDPNTLDDDPANDGLDSPGATVPAEIGRPHVRGALSAARQPDQINPLRASSPSQFYLVQGRPFGAREMPQIEAMVRQGTADPAFSFAPDLAARYAAEGGAPYLDGQYTVFGETLEGLDVLDAIAAVPTDGMDRPAERIWMVVRPVADYIQPEPATSPAVGD